MVIYMDRDSAESLSNDDIKKLIEKAALNDKYERLKDYYIGNHAINKYEKKDSSAPNNRLVANLAKYITDTGAGYFLGKPVVYSSKDMEFLKKLQEIFDFNEEMDENMELSKAASIYGHIFEMVYLDEMGNPCFVRVNPKNVIMIYERENIKPIACIRIIKTYNKNNEILVKAEYYTDYTVTYFVKNRESFVETDKKEHYFQAVPFIEFINNEERLGDFERVISLIDAYNKVNSNTANLYQYNDEALLKITKLGQVTSSDIKRMKEDGAVILEDGGDIGWLIKDVPFEGMEAYKTRLKNDIHSLSGVPDMTDEKFGGNLSGIAMSYKLWHLEQLCAVKERKFKKALQRRIMLISTIMNLKGGSHAHTDIEIEFRRNKPQNLLELSEIVTKLAGEVSKQTRLKLLPFINDIQEEMERLEDEDMMPDSFENTQKFIAAIKSGDSYE